MRAVDVLTSPGHLISLAARAFVRLSEARVRPLGFGVGQVPVLVALERGEADTQAGLARFVRVEQPPMAQMLARMERDGLIERRADPADGRRQRIRLTADARQRLPGACATVLGGNRDALAGFDDRECEQLLDLLQRLIRNLDRLNAASVPPAHEGESRCDDQPCR
jgi:MarR family transcriptional regulator, transcriptional regulator for hemolysin